MKMPNSLAICVILSRFLAAGAVCLLGSQLILYPVAFLFFAAAALFVLRPLPEGSPR